MARISTLTTSNRQRDQLHENLWEIYVSCGRVGSGNGDHDSRGEYYPYKWREIVHRALRPSAIALARTNSMDEFTAKCARVSVKKNLFLGGEKRKGKRMPTLRTANCRRWCAGWDEQGCGCESLISLCGLPLFNRSRELWRWLWIVHNRDESLFRKYTFEKNSEREEE